MLENSGSTLGGLGSKFKSNENRDHDVNMRKYRLKGVIVPINLILNKCDGKVNVVFIKRENKIHFFCLFTSASHQMMHLLYIVVRFQSMIWFCVGSRLSQPAF